MSILLSLSFLKNNISQKIYKTFYQEIQKSVTNNLLKLTNSTVSHQEYYNSKLENLEIQTSTYNKFIPIVYGKMIVAGNIIWAKPIKELITEKRKIKSLETSNIMTSYFNYNYNATFAIAICKGEVETLSTVWANDQVLDLRKIKHRFYEGNEIQVEDPIIKEIEKECPAYRGISYIVIEDFSLKNYNNKIPNFKFEIIAKNNHKDYIAKKVSSIHITPGLGEFAYDTEIIKKARRDNIGDRNIVYGKVSYANKNSQYEEADALLSLKKLNDTFPNLEWVSVVVNWYFDDIDIRKCKIYPAVEFHNTERILSQDWKVANISRIEAKIVSTSNALGTINDSSLKKFLKELKRRNYKIMLYPVIIIDSNNNKSWSGEITGEAKDIKNFFQNQYNPFIKHYCQIAKEISVDCFVIGSELSGLTKICTNQKVYPAITELISLASFVKKNLKNTLITYAAGYKEYHSINYDYNMDDLWSSPYIDVVGINAYFPLIDNSNHLNNAIKTTEIIEGWSQGEGYEYFYSKNQKIYYDEKTIQYAWKNIEQWWNNNHINLNGVQSNWKKRMKKIWFISYGFPSIKNCASLSGNLTNTYTKNELSRLFDIANSDFQTQRICIEGTIKKWQNSEIVEKMFLWGWSILPSSYFSDTSIMQDEENWYINYDIQEKFTSLTLQEILKDIFIKVKIDNYTIDVEQNFIKGYTITERSSAKDILENLQNIYFFDIVEQDSKILLIKKSRNYECTIPINETVLDDNRTYLRINKRDEEEIITQINLLYLSQDYKINFKSAQNNLFDNFNNKRTIESPIVLHENQAQEIVRLLIEENISESLIFNLILSIKYLYLNVSDIIKISLNNGNEHVIRIIKLEISNFKILVTGLSHDFSLYSY